MSYLGNGGFSGNIRKPLREDKEEEVGNVLTVGVLVIRQEVEVWKQIKRTYHVIIRREIICKKRKKK